jgi:hypothetical protein
MNSSPQYDAQFGRNRWVAYFDLLAISSLIATDKHVDVFFALSEAQRRAKESQSEEVYSVWFSDTFVLYSDGDSKSDFVAVHTEAVWFMYWLTLKLVPVRGALAFGDFYADGGNQLFFGRALIESYRYGESQDWLGLVVAPSAEARLRDVGMPLGKHLLGDYARWQIPFKSGSNIPEKELFACLFAGATDLPSRQFCIDRLREMKGLAEKNASVSATERQRIADKYERTLAFLEQNVRIVAKD